MDGFIRLIGVALIAVFVAWSVNLYQEEMAVTEDRTTVRLTEDDDLPTIIEARVDPSPELLAYRPGFAAGAYSIEDLPGSKDKDYSLRSSSKTSTEPAYPPEDGLVSGVDARQKGSLRPGLYATDFGTTECEYQLRRVMKDREERVIGSDWLAEGRLLVEINEVEPDSFTSSFSCGEWAPWSAVSEPLKVAGDGDYWIGDLARGEWTIPDGCLWEKVVSFRGARLVDVEESGRGPDDSLYVGHKTFGVRIRNCMTPIVHNELAD